MKMKHRLEERIFDLKIVTINDYSVEIDLTAEQVQDFYRYHYLNDPTLSEALQLQAIIK